MFAEFTTLEGAKIAINLSAILYAAPSSDKHSFLYYGLLHSNFIEIAEDYSTVLGLLNPVPNPSQAVKA